jgi:hypothetical protein
MARDDLSLRDALASRTAFSKVKHIPTLIGEPADTNCHSGNVVGTHPVEERTMIEDSSVFFRDFLKFPKHFAIS